jgi:gas vesicle protein
MAGSTSTNLATALVGAAGGALALYLLDPQSGKQRREQLATAAQEAMGAARERIESLAGTAREQAARVQDAASKVTEAVRPLQDAAKSHIADAAGAASTARDTVSRLVEETQSALDELRHRGRNAAAAMRGEEPSSGVLPVALSAVGFCAAGIGLMWLMDPERGHSRRAMMGQQARHILNKTSRNFHSTGKHLRNKFAGYAAVAQRTVNEHLPLPPEAGDPE